MEALRNLWEISLALSPVILLLLLVSPLLGRRYGARLRCLVWLALALRLLIPINTPMPFKLTVELPEPEVWFTAPENTQTAGAIQGGITQPENAGQADTYGTIAVVWAVGAGLFLLYHAGAYYSATRRLRRWSVQIIEGETFERFAKIKEELTLTRDVRLFRSAKAASPLLTGLLRPYIVLPERPLEPEQLDFMLRHELTHLKRGDLWQKLWLLLANAAHWFNPLVWLLAAQMNFDTELACDSAMLANAGQDERRAYGYTVLSFIEQGWRCRTPLTSRFTGGKRQLRQRFFNIADTSAKKRGVLLLFALILVIALAGSAVYAAEPESKSTLKQQSEADAAKFNIVVKEFTETKSTTPEAKAPAVTKPAPGTKTPAKPEKPSEPTSVSEPATPAVIASSGNFIWPVNGEFRVVADRYAYPGHTGIDIRHKGIPNPTFNGPYRAPVAHPVYAARAGTVVKAKKEGYGYGRHVIIDHGDGYVTLYAHCSEVLAEVGDVVEQGWQIAKTGSTGNAYGEHLHFEVRYNGNIKNPMDYLPELVVATAANISE